MYIHTHAYIHIHTVVQRAHSCPAHNIHLHARIHTHTYTYIQLCKGHTVVLHIEEVPEDVKLQIELYEIIKHMLASLQRCVHTKTEFDGQKLQTESIISSVSTFLLLCKGVYIHKQNFAVRSYKQSLLIISKLLLKDALCLHKQNFVVKSCEHRVSNRN